MAAELNEILGAGIEREVSDIHITGGQRIFFRELGELRPYSEAAVEAELMEKAVAQLLTAKQYERLVSARDIDFSYELDGRRFRGNAYYQQGNIALALRLLPANIPSLEAINSPLALKRLTCAEQGLIIVCGPTGSGKSTTLAAYINELNKTRPAHIITLEDPLEFIYPPDRAFISQRELGRDFHSYTGALRSALREMPDVVMIGELRDSETMRTALMAAETGMLVLGTLHSRRAAEAARRIESMFPAQEQELIRSQLAEVLTAIFAQQLLPAATGGRVCLSEVLLADTAARSLIRQGKYGQLDSVMLSHGAAGMQTREMAASALLRQGRITAATRDKVLATTVGKSL